MIDLDPIRVLERLIEMRAVTGSWLAAYASGAPLVPGTIRVEEGSHCAACGHRFLRGELAHKSPTAGSVSFNDAYSMRGSTEAPVCSGCAAVWEGKYMQVWAKAVACTEGLFKFSSNEDCSWFLLNQPQPPFVMAYGMAKQQHVYWRTPVSWSNDVFFLRVGNHVSPIRRSVVDRIQALSDSAVEATAEWLARQDGKAIKQRGGRLAKIKTHAFQRVDYKLAAPAHGLLKVDVQRYLASGEAPRELHTLSELNMLEAWCAARILNAKVDQLHHSRPAPVAAPNQS